MKKGSFFTTLVLSVGLTCLITAVVFSLSIQLYIKVLLVITFLGVVFLYFKKYLKKLSNELKQNAEKIMKDEIIVSFDKNKIPSEISPVIEAVDHLLLKRTDWEVAKIEFDRIRQESERIRKTESELEEQRKNIERKEKEFYHRIRNLQILYEITSTINSALDLNDVLSKITDEITKRLGYSRFAILLKDEDDESLVVKAASGYGSANIVGMRFLPGEGVSGLVMQTGETVVISDTKSDKRYLHWKGEYYEEGSFLCIPIKYKNGSIGVFNFNSDKKDAFSSEDIEFLSVIANQAAIAIQNANFYTKVKMLSERDELTGLYTRRVLFEKINKLIEKSDGFSVMIADLDNFKSVNMKNGHIFGDTVLREVALTLKNMLRRTDIVARFGGDEFALIFPETSSGWAEKVAEKIINHFEDKKFAEGKVSLTLSLGLAEYPNDGKTAEDLLEIADKGLLLAKSIGGSTFAKSGKIDSKKNYNQKDSENKI